MHDSYRVFSSQSETFSVIVVKASHYVILEFVTVTVQENLYFSIGQLNYKSHQGVKTSDRSLNPTHRRFRRIGPGVCLTEVWRGFAGSSVLGTTFVLIEREVKSAGSVTSTERSVKPIHSLSSWRHGLALRRYADLKVVVTGDSITPTWNWSCVVTWSWKGTLTSVVCLVVANEAI